VSAEDRIEVEDLARRYSHGIDTRDWTMVQACFADDALCRGQSFTGPAPQYLAQLRRGVETFAATMHFLGNHLTEVSGDSAHMGTYGICYHLTAGADGAVGPVGSGSFVIGVNYVDDVIRRDGRWQIQQRSVFGIWRQELATGVQILAGRTS
jgi:hypothetical protein